MIKNAVKVGITALLLGLWACESINDFDDTPSLEWRSAQLRQVGDSLDNRQVFDLKIYFTDGDGNVGSAEEANNDTCDIKNYSAFLSRYDLFIYYYERVNGRFIEIPPVDSCLPFHNILPNLTPEGQNKTLEGEISTPFEYSNFPANNTDSVKFDLVLRDRAGNESNRLSSPAIAL
jgi:hypothetical protein